MKKVLFAAIALIGISAAGFAQNTPVAKKNETAKTQVAKKSATKKQLDATAKKTDMDGHKKARKHKKHNS